MTENILSVQNLCKNYPQFSLKNISFDLPYGSIMGLIGENGAGKSTTLKAILGLSKPDSGTVQLLGGSIADKQVRAAIGVVFDENKFPLTMTGKELEHCLASIYPNWQSSLFADYMEQFQVPQTRKVAECSRGMKLKLAIAVALAHQPQLLILDEATAGLDPVVRDEILEVFLDFVKDGQHSILFSSHITSDLEKCADHVTFIHAGGVLFSKAMDDLLENYGIVKGDIALYQSLDKDIIEAWRERDGQYEVLVKDRAGLDIGDPALDEIMVLLVRGQRS